MDTGPKPGSPTSLTSISTTITRPPGLKPESRYRIAGFAAGYIVRRLSAARDMICDGQVCRCAHDLANPAPRDHRHHDLVVLAIDFLFLFWATVLNLRFS